MIKLKKKLIIKNTIKTRVNIYIGLTRKTRDPNNEIIITSWKKNQNKF